MKHGKLFLTLLLFFTCVFFLYAKEFIAKTATDTNNFTYEYVSNDPYGGRIYTLNNGLKVFLSRNPVKPRIVVRFAVKAGLADSPADATGLAHYLEHLMFKGTDKIGALDYKKEKVLLDKIEQLYEKRRKEKDPAKKNAIFKEIDSLSLEASRYAAAGEYSKLIAALGGMELNAFTSNDVTAYVVDIPSNELDRFLFLESERLRNPVIRLFHTELEAVYQEFNHGQDNDDRKLYEAVLASLFPTHPYGWTPIIGKAVHLKEPSITLVKKFMEKYYVPGNMALALSGDLQYDETIRKVAQYFSFMKKADVPQRNFPPEKEMTKNIVTQITGIGPEKVAIAFRVKKGKRNELLGTLLAQILHNGNAGLVDSLITAQKVHSASAFFSCMRDHSFLLLQAQPVAEKTLEETSSMLLETLEKVKKGSFDNDLLPSVISNFRLAFEEGRNDPETAAWTFLNSFISGVSYVETLRELGEAAKISKKEIMEFASSLSYYVQVFRKNGKADKRVLMEKPPITKIAVNGEKLSAFGKNFLSMQSGKELEAELIDFKKDIIYKDSAFAKNAYKLFISNKKAPANDKLFSMDIMSNAGAHHEELLPVAITYLDYLGTNMYSAESFRKKIYKDAIKLSFYCTKDNCGITLAGLGENLSKALNFARHFMENVKADPLVYKRLIDHLANRRKKAKKEQKMVFTSLNMYAAYGAGKKNNPFVYADSISIEELQKLDPEKLVLLAKKYLGFSDSSKKVISYVGPHTEKELDKMIFSHLYKNTLPEKSFSPPAKRNFSLLAPGKSKVYLYEFDSVQLLFGIRSRMEKFDEAKLPYILLFNQYFGAGGLDSIVFQEIREARGLAYSAFAFYIPAKEIEKYNAFATYSGLQKDKFFEAADAFFTLLRKMPVNHNAFAVAKANVIKQLVSQKYYGNLYPIYEKNRKRGILKDNRREVVEKIKKISLQDLEKFFYKEIANASFDMYICGRVKDLDRKKLAKYGTVMELTSKDTFGY